MSLSAMYVTVLFVLVIQTDRRSIRTRPEPQAHARIVRRLDAWIRSELRFARDFARLETSSTWAEWGCASVVEYGTRHGYRGAQVRRWAVLGKAMAAVPELEPLVLAQRIPIEQAETIAPLLLEPALEGERGEWMDLAERTSARRLRSYVSRRLEQVRQERDDLQPITFWTTRRAKHDWHRACDLINARKHRRVSEGEAFAYLVDHFLDEEDPLRRAVRIERARGASGSAASRAAPSPPAGPGTEGHGEPGGETPGAGHPGPGSSRSGALGTWASDGGTPGLETAGLETAGLGPAPRGAAGPGTPGPGAPRTSLASPTAGAPGHTLPTSQGAGTARGSAAESASLRMAVRMAAASGDAATTGVEPTKVDSTVDRRVDAVSVAGVSVAGVSVAGVSADGVSTDAVSADGDPREGASQVGASSGTADVPNGGPSPAGETTRPRRCAPIPLGDPHDFLGPAARQRRRARARRGDEEARRRHVPAGVRRQIWLRAGGVCEVPGCACGRDLQLCHIRAWARGGANGRWNLLLLCPRHHTLLDAGRLRFLRWSEGLPTFRLPDGKVLHPEARAPPGRGLG